MAMTDITLSISTITAITGAIGTIVTVIGGVYSYVQSLRDKALADTLKLNFEHITESLKRMDEYAVSTRVIVDEHGRAISMHDTRIAVLETRVAR